PALDLASYVERMAEARFNARNSVVGASMLRREPVVVPDTRAIDPDAHPFIRITLAAGIGSLLSLPFDDGEQRFALTVFYLAPQHHLPGLTTELLRLRQPVETLLARRRTDAEVRIREASFRMLFAGNPVPMWVHDRQTGAFLEVNAAAQAKYGWSRDEF